MTVEGLPPSLERAVNRLAAVASKREQRQSDADQDRALIELAKAGDQDAFKQLVQRHQRRAQAIAMGVLRNEQEALDVVQEAFLRVYRGLDGFNGGASFFTWLYRIVHNLAIDVLRRPARRDAPLPEGRELEQVDSPLLARLPEADPLDLVRRGELAARLQEALDALPSYHRSVILMREVEGMSYEEMAQAMEVSKGTIMSRLFHARRKLQLALADCYREQVGRLPGEEGE